MNVIHGPLPGSFRDSQAMEMEAMCCNVDQSAGRQKRMIREMQVICLAAVLAVVHDERIRCVPSHIPSQVQP